MPLMPWQMLWGWGQAETTFVQKRIGKWMENDEFSIGDMSFPYPDSFILACQKFCKLCQKESKIATGVGNMDQKWWFQPQRNHETNINRLGLETARQRLESVWFYQEPNNVEDQREWRYSRGNTIADSQSIWINLYQSHHEPDLSSHLQQISWNNWVA